MDEADLGHPTTAAPVTEPVEQGRPLGSRPHLLYLAWAVAWFVGLVAMWVGVLGKHPYPGPQRADVVVLVCLVAAATLATIVTATVANRSDGRLSTEGSTFVLAWVVGFAATVSALAALDEYGATATAFWVIGASLPVLVTGLIFLVGSAVWSDQAMAWLGGWLVLVAATAAWAGPVWALAVEALAVGGGFLTAAVWTRMHAHGDRGGSLTSA